MMDRDARIALDPYGYAQASSFRLINSPIKKHWLHPGQVLWVAAIVAQSGGPTPSDFASKAPLVDEP